MATQFDHEAELDGYTRSADLFEALSYGLACNKSWHQELRSLQDMARREPARVGACCAFTIEQIVTTLSEILDGLVAMVDETRRSGRSWTKLPRSQKGIALRNVFQRVEGSWAGTFEDPSTVWWEPIEP
jgi:hypothetical protein